jgi:2-amino-4-hydroxy-6-hydroxymethyldihydropteridine diphosphokinase
MARVYISIGSNIEAEKNVRFAIDALKKQYGDITLSSVYESEAVGFDGDNFLNLVVALDTEDDVFTVATSLREIEDRHGRDRSGPRFSARTVDLDLLLYDDVILHQDKLDIPRHEIIKNAFVLWPLAEIAPQQVHPENQKTMAELWDAFDKTSQRLWPIEFTS